MLYWQDFHGLQGFIQKFWLGVGEIKCMLGGGGGGGLSVTFPVKKKAYLMRIAIEGPDLGAVNFDEVLDIFKQRNRQIRL